MDNIGGLTLRPRRSTDLGRIYLLQAPKAGELGRWGALATLRRAPPEPPAKETDVEAVRRWAQGVVQRESSGAAVYDAAVGDTLTLWLTWFDQRATGSWYVLQVCRDALRVYYSTGEKPYCNVLAPDSLWRQSERPAQEVLDDLAFCTNWPVELRQRIYGRVAAAKAA